MSAELEEIFNNIFDNLVDKSWAKVAYPSLKPLGNWISDMIKRIEFIRKWIDDGPP